MVDYGGGCTLLCKVEASVSSSSKEEELGFNKKEWAFFLGPESLAEYEDLDSSS